MIGRKEFRFRSSNGADVLHGEIWLPEGEPWAVLQIVHGMKEHIGRYGEFARWMASQGILVAGHDQLGHGRSAADQDRGTFGEKNGAAYLVRDIHLVAGMLHRRWPGVPHFMIGHSMGSFLLRRYIALHGEGLDGVILMGTGGHTIPVVMTGTVVASIMGMLRGRDYRSPLLYKIVTGKFSEVFRPYRTAHDWLSRDSSYVKDFVQDPYCDFYFTCGAYEDFFQVLMDLNLSRQFGQIPKGLPILLVSGEKDPVGWFGKGVRRVYQGFRRLEMEDVEMKLYPGARHELLHEIGREKVFADLYRWIKSCNSQDSVI